MENEKNIAKVTKVFTIKGKEDLLDQEGHPVLKNVFDPDSVKFVYAENRPHAYAKLEMNNGKILHYILTNSGSRRLKNPLDPNEVVKSGQYKMVNDKWFYKTVSEETFNFYLKFLSTKNQLFYIYAERSYL